MRRLGVTVTPYQLERWRRLGLLPRVTVRHLRRGGSSVEPHPDTTFRAIQLLAMHAVRGSSAQDLTWLLVFANLPVTLECLRSAAQRAVLRPHAAVARLW